MSKNKQFDFIDKKIIYLSILGWGGLAIFLVAFVVFKRNPYDFTVTYNYWDASYKWILGQSLNETGAASGFLYFPQSAILQIPFALLPFRLAEVIWRILNIFLLALSCFYMVKLWKNVPRNILYFFISVITIALSYDSLRNGQINIILTVLSVFVAYNLAHNRYKTCVVLCLLGTALKPHMIVPLLLVVGVYPKRCIPTAIIGTVLFFLFPFLCQHPDYVVNQYKNTLTILIAAQNLGHERPWPDFFGMLNLVGINISQISVYFTSFLVGVVIYINSIVFFRRKKGIGSILIMTLAVSFILLFSGRTEMNTYCMFGPFMGILIFFSTCINANKTKWIYFFVSPFCWFFIFGAHAVSGAIAPSLKSSNCPWTAPLAFTIFIVYTLIYLAPKINTDDFESKYFISG
jgi:hypothetical protein